LEKVRSCPHSLCSTLGQDLTHVRGENHVPSQHLLVSTGNLPGLHWWLPGAASVQSPGWIADNITAQLCLLHCSLPPGSNIHQVWQVSGTKQSWTLTENSTFQNFLKDIAIVTYKCLFKNIQRIIFFKWR
jgi:hypothetical protein